MVYSHMPWGKFEGVRLQDLPPKYVAWVLANLLDVDPDLRRDLRQVLAEGREGGRAPPRRRPQSGPPADWPAVLRQVHHEMVLKFHPDRGGSHEAMVAVNAVFERLQQLGAA